MKWNRQIGMGAVSLTKLSPPRFDIEVLKEVKEELEPILISSGYLETAPFKWVGIIFRYGLVNEEIPHYQKINKKYGDLPIAIEVDIEELRSQNREGLKKLFMVSTLKSLIHVGETFNLPNQALKEKLETFTSKN